MRLQYWIDKYSRKDPSFRRDLCPAYVTEAQKYNTNIDYYYNTNDPAVFASLIYYKKQDLIIGILYKIIFQLRMNGIVDPIKSCILVVTNPATSDSVLKQNLALIDKCRSSYTGKNHLLSCVISYLIVLRRNKPVGLIYASSIIKMILSFIGKDDSSEYLMRILRKNIDPEIFESCFVESTTHD